MRTLAITTDYRAKRLPEAIGVRVIAEQVSTPFSFANWLRLPRWFRRPLTGDKRVLLIATLLSASLHAALFFAGEGKPVRRVAAVKPSRDEETLLELVVPEPEAACPDASDVSCERCCFEAPSVPTTPELRVTLNDDPSRLVIDVSTLAVGRLAFDADAFARQLGQSGSSGVGKGFVFDLAELDQPPVVQSQPLPSYPPGMLHSGVTGEVLVGFVVNPRGEVCQVRVLESSRSEFELAAVQAVSSWRFKAGRKHGRAVAVRMEAPIAFLLPGRTKP